MGGRGCDLIKAIRVGQREVLEFECDGVDHDGRQHRRAWFQLFQTYDDGVRSALYCGWTESTGGWLCSQCSRKAPTEKA